jgi:hypothetical protein
MTIEDALNMLKGREGDSEIYHSTFNDIIEKRLMELDPDFMTALQEVYKNFGAARWCA